MLTFFLCIVSDTKWDSETGIGISGLAFLMSAPFVQYSLKFADKVAVPMVAGLSLAASAQIFLNIIRVTDMPPYYIKTITEATCIILGSLIAFKL